MGSCWTFQNQVPIGPPTSAQDSPRLHLKMLGIGSCEVLEIALHYLWSLNCLLDLSQPNFTSQLYIHHLIGSHLLNLLFWPRALLFILFPPHWLLFSGSFFDVKHRSSPSLPALSYSFSGIDQVTRTGNYCPSFCLLRSIPLLSSWENCFLLFIAIIFHAIFSFYCLLFGVGVVVGGHIWLFLAFCQLLDMLSRQHIIHIISYHNIAYSQHINPYHSHAGQVPYPLHSLLYAVKFNFVFFYVSPNVPESA